jgi:DNA mismatch repair protein MutS
VSGDDLSVRALGALFAYLQETARGDLRQFQKITPAASGSGMLIDYTARRNLELFESLRSGERRGSLLWVLDQTVTPLGARSIRHMLESPLYSLDAINSRLDAVEELARRTDLRGTLRQALKTVKDIERLAVRSGTPQANARDLRALGDSLKALPALKDSLQGAASGLLAELAAAMPLEAELAATLTTALVETPPLTVREGGMIASGYDAEVDRLRVLTNEQGEWLSAYEERERTRTGVKTLKVGFNKVFGYYVEVSKANTKDLPAEYVRKQTLVNAERYITEELKRFEDEILTASDQLVSREYELFEGLRAETAAHRGALLRAAERVGCIDALASLAEVAVKNGYVRPRLNNAGRVDIRAGRHPVIEQVAGRHKFVENDTALDEGGILLITGPNMAGKSTYMRQVALIVIMAQMGSFVPAASADIGLVDRVFTRVGAADDLFSGQSTFMVEMTEVANILHNATHESLIILDEIGRGTSTYDGMSIARAVVEYIHSNRRLRSRTLFATHYHELTRLDEELDHLRNLSMAVLEQGDDVVFLRKVVSGGTDRSYGIHVARLAGLPEDVINRARKVLGDLETKQANPALRESAAAGVQQIGLFMTHPVLDRLMSMDLNRVTPMDALALLYDFQSQVRAERGGPGRE